MIAVEIAITGYMSIVALVSCALALPKIIHAPILELKLLLATALTVLLQALLFSTAGFLALDGINPASLYLFKLGWGTLGPFYIFMTFAFMLPSFKVCYRDIFYLSMIVAINISMILNLS